MRYLIYRTLQKLWIHKKIYIVIALELAIGMAVVMCGTSSASSAKSRQEALAKQIGEQGAVIEYYASSDFIDTELPITAEDYKIIREKYSELNISYLLYTHSIYQTQKSLDVKNVTFVSMDENTFLSCFGFAPEEDTIYLGSQIAEDLAEEELCFYEKWFSWDDSGFKIGDSNIAHIEKLKAVKTNILFTQLADLKSETMFLFPEACMHSFECNAGEQLIPCLRIVSTSKVGELDVSCEVVELLQDKHPAYTYRVSKQYLELQKSINDLTQEIRLFSWVAWLVLTITMVGIIGILLIYMEKRKREFAIILALGGTHTTIFKEIFLEVFLLCCVSGLIGLIATIITVPFLSTSVFTAYFHWMSVAVMIGIVFMITTISCTCMIWKIRDIYPTKILKK